MTSDIHVRQADASSVPNPRRKPAPKATCVSVPFVYTPSDDGTDENLLVLLHGLGGSSSKKWITVAQTFFVAQ